MTVSTPGAPRGSLASADGSTRIMRVDDSALRENGLLAASEEVRNLLGDAGEVEPTWFGTATPAIDRLGPDGILDATVGWLRMGGESEAIVSSLFVVSRSTLFVAPQGIDLELDHIALADVTAIDLIDGVDLPLEAVEVRMNNDMTVFVGWPERFCESVVEVLRAVDEPVVVPSPELDETDETELEPTSSLDVDPDVGNAFFGSSDPTDVRAGVTFSASSSPDDASSRGPRRSPTGVFTFRDSVMLVDTANPSRRKKNLTLVVDAAGLSALANGFGHWSTTISTAEITDVAIAGVDEVMYTHSLKIAERSTALVIERMGSRVAFEIPDMEPNTLRAMIGSLLDMWLARGRDLEPAAPDEAIDPRAVVSGW